MGRKIPGKKHRGVKDPEEQRAKRLAKLETKINAPPENDDEQYIPKSLQRVIELKNAAKNNSLLQKRRKKKKGSKLIKLGAEQSKIKFHPKGRPEKVVPIFNQRPGETNYQFFNRVKRETHAFVNETRFENKFNVEVKRNAETGEVEGLVKKPKDELDQIEKLRSKHKNIGKKKKSTNEEGISKLTKGQKRKEKLLKKKQRKTQEDVDDFKKLSDKVEFGDIVHAPPVLKIHSKNTQGNTNKINTKGLLLNSILKGESMEKEKSGSRTGKRKNLPVGERRLLEKQQSNVVAAYRLLKSRKLGESSLSA